jgi:probable rRNA maturation factor
MNTRFRHRPRTTDILTFVYPPDHVELYMSLSVARRQARERGVGLSQECQRLLVHGLCHVAGMDHYTVADFQQMRRTECEVLVQCLVA